MSTTATNVAWEPITGACPKCGAVGTCFKAGRAVACRFASRGEIRIHVGLPPNSKTFALSGVDAGTPDFPRCISEYTVSIAEGGGF